MELFKLFGTIAIKNADANEAIDDTTDKAEQSENKISSAFKKIGKAAATYFAVDKIKNFGLNCINAASDAQAASSQFAQVFGNMEESAGESLKGIADDTNISVNRMKGSYSQIAAFAKTTGMDTEGALGLANRAMVAVADSAAYYDRSLEDTTGSLQSFLKGNYENDAALGLSCTETTRNASANKLYGKSFKDLSESQKQLTLLQMVEDANAASGALGQAARESGTWTNQTGNLKQAWKDFQATLGENVLPTAVDVVKKAAKAIESLSDKIPGIVQAFKDWSPLIAGVVTGLVTLKSALMISSLIGTITKAWKAYKIANEGATAAQWLLTAAMNANPIVLIVTLIAGLIAAVVTLWNTNEDFRNKIIEIWNSIKEAFGAAVDAVKGFFSDLGGKCKETWENIKTATSEKWNSIKSTISDTWGNIKSAVSEKADLIKSKVSTAWENIKTTTSEKWNSIKSKIEEHGGGIKGVVGAFTDDVKERWKAGFEKINELTGGKLGEALEKARSKLASIKEAFTDKLGAARDFVKGAIDKIKGFFNFHWELPKIKLPHFSITGKFSLAPPSIPHFGVEWYKKAMDEPYMFTKPTIFDMNPVTGKVKGAGEAGDELMVGKNTMLDMIRSAVTVENAKLAAKFDVLISLLNRFFPEVLKMLNTEIVLDGDALVGRLAPAMNKELGVLYKQKGRGNE